MRTKPFGASRESVSVMGQGTWHIDRGDRGTDDLDELLDVAGHGTIACNQVIHHLQERAIEHAVVPWCAKHNVAVVAYSPFGHDDFPASDSRGGKILQTIAATHGATPRQIALAFLTREPTVFAIPKAASAAHATDNAAAGRMTLSAAEIAQIDAAFPRGKPPRSLPML